MAGRTHDAVPDCKTSHALPEAFDFAHAFEAEDRARAADRAMLMAGEHKKIGTVSAAALTRTRISSPGVGVSTVPTPALFLSATTMARIVFLMAKQFFSSLSSQLARRLPAANIRAKRADGRRYGVWTINIIAISLGSTVQSVRCSPIFGRAISDV